MCEALSMVIAGPDGPGVMQEVTMARRKKKKIDLLTAIRGELRALHFKAGGTPSNWRGLAAVHKNKRNKRKNRRVQEQQAIAEQN